MIHPLSSLRRARNVTPRWRAVYWLVIPLAALLVSQAPARAQSAVPHPHRAELLTKLGELRKSGKPGAVEEFVRKQLAATRGLARDDERRANVLELALLAAIDRAQSGTKPSDRELADAAELIRTRRAASKADHYLVAVALQMSGTLLFASDRTADADRAFEEMVDEFRKAYPKGGRDLADRLGRTAFTIAEGFHRPETAARLYREAIGLRRVAGKEATVELGADLQSLAMLQMNQLKDWEGAAAGLEEAGRIFEELLRRMPAPGDLADRLAQVLVLRAGIERDRGATAGAMKLLAEAEHLPVHDKAEERERSILINLGRVRIAEMDGDLEKAVQYYDTIINHIAENVRGSEQDPANWGLMLDCLLGKARAMVKLDKLADAREAAEVARKGYATDDPALADVLFVLADIERREGHVTQQDALYRDALKLRRQAASEALVFFATNRRRLEDKKALKFADQAGSELVFGRGVVLVPGGQFSNETDRRTGAVEISTFGSSTNPDQLTLRDATVVDWPHIAERMRRQAEGSKLYGRSVLVFVHGYNVGFDDAVKRMGQFIRDLNHDGAAIVYSWPSAGQWWRYGTDRKTATEAARGLAELVSKLVRDAGFERIHMVAHSMGNRVLLPALAALDEGTLRNHIGEVVFAAPAVSVSELSSGIDTLLGRGLSKFTLYASRNDNALRAGFIREYGTTLAGYIPNGTPFLHRGLETIDVSAGGDEPFEFNHDVFAGNPAIIADIRLLLQRGARPPERRLKFLRKQSGPDGDYWRYVPK